MSWLVILWVSTDNLINLARHTRLEGH